MNSQQGIVTYKHPLAKCTMSIDCANCFSGMTQNICTPLLSLSISCPFTSFFGVGARCWMIDRGAIIMKGASLVNKLGVEKADI